MNLSEKKAMRCAAGILGIGMLVIVLLSAIFITVEADHDCTGEECPICVSIRQCESTLRQIGNSAAAGIMVSVPVLIVFFAVTLFAGILRQETPVSRKVRLNN